MFELLERPRVAKGEPLTARECRRRFEAGKLRLDGRDRVPFHFLWFSAALVIDFMQRELRADLEVVDVNGQHATPLAAHYELRMRCRDDLYELGRRGPYVRFDRVDSLFTRYGLGIEHLGDPLFSTHPMVEPRAVAS